MVLGDSTDSITYVQSVNSAYHVTCFKPIKRLDTFIPNNNNKYSLVL